MLTIDHITLGPLDTNCWIVSEGDTCWLFDVGMWSKPLVERLNENGLSPQRICLTHGHGDHIGGVDYLREIWPEVHIVCPQRDVPMLTSPELNLSATFLMGITAPEPNEIVNGGDKLAMIGRIWEVLDTAGHTEGGVSYYSPVDGVVITGDALFAGSIGRSDIPGGDGDLLVKNICGKLLALPDETRVLPGHGPETTIGEQRESNPYLQG